MDESARIDLPAWQRVVRDRCHHPSGTFTEFKREDVEQSIPDRFERIVRTWPDRTAIKSKHESVTYTELNRAANRVAETIIELRERTAEPIAVLADPDVAGIGALLGVLKSGKFYVPLDPSFPPARTAFMLEDCQAPLIVTTKPHLPLAASLAGVGRKVLTINAGMSGADPGNPRPSISPDALASLLYTSGSSGQPKGVTENQRNVLHEVMRLTNDLRICCEDRITLLNSLSFSGSARSVYGSLLNGAMLVPYNFREEGPGGLPRLLIDEGVTIYRSGPTIFRQFVAALRGHEQFPRLRLITTAGEPVLKSDMELYRRHFGPGCLFVNGLRSTEAGSVRHYFADQDTDISGATVAVGFPIEDMKVILLDDAGAEVPRNEVGEIAVRSRYLSPGYWKRPQLTKAKFLQDAGGSGERLFLTGDLGIMQDDGCLVYLGRKDSQVKIRGQRVELAEIEDALLALDAVNESVVVARNADTDAVQLVAYVVPAPGATPTTSALRRAVAQNLPGAMVPSRFVVLDALPVTPTGKVDRRALPNPGTSRPAIDGALVSPRSAIEQELAALWADILGLDEVGIHDDFFDLGGDSLSAVTMLLEVEKRFGRRLPPAALALAPTVEQLADILRHEGWTAPRRSLVPLRATGQRPPLFCLPGHLGTVRCFRQLAQYLGPDQPVYGLEARGLDGAEPPHTTIQEMAAAYLTEILACEPRGPYFLAGYCFGARVAFEMARQLTADGRAVGLLALIDSYGPGVGVSNAPFGRRLLRRLTRRLSIEAEALALLGPREKLAYAVARIHRARTRAVRPFERALRLVPAVDPNVERVADAHRRAVGRYEPGIYSGPAVLIRAGHHLAHYFIDPQFGWGHHVGGALTVRILRGPPGTLLQPSLAPALAEELRSWLPAR